MWIQNDKSQNGKITKQRMLQNGKIIKWQMLKTANYKTAKYLPIFGKNI